jgi:hypothetical protein
MSDPDFCDDLLAPPTTGDVSPLQRGLLERTTRALRRRHWLRRLGWAAALAACYAAGVLTMALRPTPPSPVPPRPVDPPTTAGPSKPSAVDLEWTALEDPDLQPAPYRQAGDRYLTEEADLQAALRCYGAALDRGGAAALAVDCDDSWLMILIKDAREKEKTDAKSGG